MEERELHITIKQCKEGNTEAFRSLVMAYHNMVFSLSLKLLCSESEAEDAVQDAFVSVWENIHRYSSEKGKFTTWLYTIATRICLDRLRHHKRTIPLPTDETTLQNHLTGTNLDKNLENSDFVSIVKVLTLGLSHHQQLVFTLSILENLDSNEITAITGLSAEKIKSNLYVARKKIKEELIHLGYEN